MKTRVFSCCASFVLLLLLAAESSTPEPPVLDTSVDTSEGVLSEALERAGRSAVAELSSELAAWDPESENDATPPACLTTEEGSWLGTWVLSRRYDSSQLIITQPGTALEVEFDSGGCVQAWSMKREAVSKGPVLELSGPVKEYYPTQPFRRLHQVRLQNEVYLLPSICLERVLDLVEAEGCKGVTYEDLVGCLFVRSLP